MFADTMMNAVKKMGSEWGLKFILKLKPSSWSWKPPLSDGRTHFGMIAQDVNEVAPRVDYGFVEVKEGYYALNYWQFIGPLVKSDHDLHEIMVKMSTRIDELTKELEDVKKRLPRQEGGKHI